MSFFLLVFRFHSRFVSSLYPSWLFSSSASSLFNPRPLYACDLPPLIFFYHLFASYLFSFLQFQFWSDRRRLTSLLLLNNFVFLTLSTNQTNTITKVEFSAQRRNKWSRKPVLTLQLASISHWGAVTRITGGIKTNQTLFLHPRLDWFAEAIALQGPRNRTKYGCVSPTTHTHTHAAVFRWCSRWSVIH